MLFDFYYILFYIMLRTLSENIITLLPAAHMFIIFFNGRLKDKRGFKIAYTYFPI